MPGVRGRVTGVYLSDNGTGYLTQVDWDRALSADFHWTVPIGGELRLPKGFRARRVVGLSATTGRIGVARVPDMSADIWTGAVTTFDVEATDGTTDTMTVIRYYGERPSLP